MGRNKPEKGEGKGEEEIKNKKEKKEKKKLKKEKRRREQEEDGGSPSKRIKEEDMDRNSLTSPGRELPSRSCAAKQKTAIGSGTLDKFLEYLLPILEEKDVNCFFAMPVPDTFAPGYSKIITDPMDFATMRGNVEEGKYKRLDQFRSDFELICTNCMVYNNLDTNYYKAAKKLMIHGERILSEERLRALAVHLPMMKDLTSAELGFVLDDETPPPTMTPEDEKDMLASLGFLRLKPDGSTSLPILTPGDGVVPGTEKDRPVSLGNLIGKVKNGTGTLQGFREDRRNVAKTIHPLYYGAFSSHGPTYDSTFANLTKRETELVLSANHDEVDKVVAHDTDPVCFMADHLLDILTNNEHRKKSAYLQEEVKFAPKPPAVRIEEIDFESLKTLSSDGIDMSFLDGIAKKYEVSTEVEDADTTEAKLGKSAKLIEDLRVAQYERLSSAPPQHLSQIQPPTRAEMELAEKVQEVLADMASNVKPGDISAATALRKAMGVSALSVVMSERVS